MFRHNSVRPRCQFSFVLYSNDFDLYSVYMYCVRLKVLTCPNNVYCSIVVFVCLRFMCVHIFGWTQGRWVQAYWVTIFYYSHLIKLKQLFEKNPINTTVKFFKIYIWTRMNSLIFLLNCFTVPADKYVVHKGRISHMLCLFVWTALYHLKSVCSIITWISKEWFVLQFNESTIHI